MISALYILFMALISPKIDIFPFWYKQRREIANEQYATGMQQVLFFISSFDDKLTMNNDSRKNHSQTNT